MAAMVQKVAPSSEFGFGFVLGEGAFAHVIHARRKSDKRDFAVKVMLKSHAEREGKTRAVLAESMALQRCAKCAFVVGLERTFQDDDYLFFVLEFASGGDLLGAIKRGAKRHAAFYAAEIWLGLEFLQDVGLAHRDLKPENVLLDSKGHVKIADFGSVLDTRQPSLRKPPAQNETRQPSLRRRPSEARPSELRQPALQRRPSSLGEAVPEERQSEDRRSFFDDERHGSFEGTAEYVSPEVLTGETTTCACDLWALGCIIFQLCTSKPPFTAPTDYLLWEMIIAFAEGRDDAALDVSGLDEDAEAMIRALLVKNGLMRLGASLESRGAFCGHAFFDQTDWPGLRLFPPTVEAPLQQVEAARVPDDGFHDFSMEFMLGLDIAGAGDSVRIVEPIRRPKEVDTFFSSMSPRSQGRTRAALERYDWAARLDVDETLVCARVVWKRKGLLWRERAGLLRRDCGRRRRPRITKLPRPDRVDVRGARALPQEEQPPL
ncbi:kinase-like domain-containing protein [Pelagophyceae sp. CCMP2097]|nr:kinase-like domain-containing protein [Pelagophyceae sp. CCMP2097]